MFVPSNKGLEAWLTSLITTFFPSSGTTAKIHLAAASFIATPTLDPSTLTEATFDGYTAKAITAVSTPGPITPGNIVAIIPAVSFTPTGTTTPNTIYGYWVVDGSGNYVGAEVFPAPVGLTGPTTTLAFIPAAGLGSFQYTSPVTP